MKDLLLLSSNLVTTQFSLTPAQTPPSPPPRPPESPPPPSPNNLRVPRDRFVGREVELEQVQGLLQQGDRLVTLLGTAGLGKSRLARELGRVTAAAWPGGVWFVELSEVRSLVGIWTALAEVLQIHLGEDPHHQLCDALAQRDRTLLILDNFEQIAHFAPQTVGQWLDASHTTAFVVTSRVPLQLEGEQVYALDLLDEPQAIALFIDRAQRVKRWGSLRDGSQSEIAALVNRLDRLPLAIELAAARTRLYSPNQLLSRLSRRFDLLRSRSTDLPKRQRTLRAALEWSWEMLDEVEQTSLAQCSVFEGGMTIEGAAAVIDVSDETVWVEEVLADLVDKSLLVSAETPDGDQRLSMLVSIQHFAAEKLGDPEAVYQRHIRHFADWVGDASEEEKRQERDNLIVASRRAITAGAIADGALCAIAALDVFERYGPLGEGIAFAEALLDALPADARPATLLFHAGHMLTIHQDLDAAEQRLRAALQRADKENEPIVTMKALNGLARLACHQRRLDAVLAYTDQVLNHPALADSPQQEALAHLNRGARALRLSQRAEALRDFTAACALARKANDPGIESSALDRMAATYTSAGRYEDGLPYLHQALAVANAAQTLETISNVTNNLAVVYRKLGRHQEAMKRLFEALRIIQQLGRRNSEIRQRCNLGYCYYSMERFPEALEQYEAAQKLTQQSRVQKKDGSIFNGLGRVCYRLNQMTRALGYFEKARQYAAETQDTHNHIIAFLGMARLYTHQRQFDEAGRYFQHAIALTQAFAYTQPAARSEGEGVMLSEFANMYRLSGEWAQAHATFQRAEQRLRALPNARLLAEMLIFRAQLHIDEDALPAARDALTEARSLLRSPDDPFHPEIDRLLTALPDIHRGAHDV